LETKLIQAQRLCKQKHVTLIRDFVLKSWGKLVNSWALQEQCSRFYWRTWEFHAYSSCRCFPLYLLIAKEAQSLTS